VAATRVSEIGEQTVVTFRARGNVQELPPLHDEVHESKHSVGEGVDGVRDELVTGQAPALFQTSGSNGSHGSHGCKSKTFVHPWCRD
jgi:hypothetical protein